MNKFRNSLKALSSVLVLMVVVFSFVACDGNEGGGATSSYIETKNISISSKGGNGEIAIFAGVGTEWNAEIVSGGEFASFDISSSVVKKGGKISSPYSNRLYIYFKENKSTDVLSAVVSFTFKGEEAQNVTFRQLSAEEEAKDPVYNWSELPSRIEKDNYMYITHFTEYKGKTIRNFSMCYDTKSYAACWVAFPYHKIYDSGDVGRNDKWGYDPKIPTAYQPNLKKSYRNDDYDRGHQCASDDRQSTKEMNAQTFYYSNMTPQLWSLNQQKWSTVEKIIRNQVCSDTLYVVTGADYSSVIGSVSDNSGKSCPIPSGYYKVMLRTRTGVTGKRVEDCEPDELKAIGYWVEHEHYTTVPEPVSVATIEKRTGFNFFPTIPQEVKETFNTSLWSL